MPWLSKDRRPVVLLWAAAVAALTCILTALDIGDKIGSPHRRYYAVALFVVFCVTVLLAVRDLFAHISVLEGQVARKRVNRELADTLTESLKEGQSISGFQLFLVDDFREFRKAEREWRQRTIERMRREGCTVQQIHAFESPNYNDFQRSPEFKEYPEPIWNDEKRMLLFRLEQLGRVIDQYLDAPIYSSARPLTT